MTPDPSIQTNAINQQAVGPLSTPGIQPAATFQPPQYNQWDQQIPTQNATLFKDQYGNFNTGNMQMILGGIQTLGSLWNSFQQHKLAKKSLALQTRAFETNLENQTQTYNTALEDRIRARYATEGRSEQADGYINEHKL